MIKAAEQFVRQYFPGATLTHDGPWWNIRCGNADLTIFGFGLNEQEAWASARSIISRNPNYEYFLRANSRAMPLER